MTPKNWIKFSVRCVVLDIRIGKRSPKPIDLNYLGFLWLDPFPEGFHMCWLPVPLGLCPAIWMTPLSKYWAPKSPWTVTTAMKLKDSSWKESYDKRR